MITEKLKTTINKYVDEFLDEIIRGDIIYLDRSRKIEEVLPGKYIVQDTDIIIDETRNYDVIFKHPIEDYFIPEKVDLVVVEYIVELELPELVNLINFDTPASGVIQSQEIPIGDSRISDDQLKELLYQTCLDLENQKIYPEVKDYLLEIYKKNHPNNVQIFLERVRPFLGI